MKEYIINEDIVSRIITIVWRNEFQSLGRNNKDITELAKELIKLGVIKQQTTTNTYLEPG